MNDAQKKVLAIHALFHQGQYPAGHAINLVESNGDNRTWITEQFTKLYGWGNGEAWCAQTCTVVGVLAGVLDPHDGSAGAWALTDHLTSLGHGIEVPEPGALLSIQEGSGHIFTLLKDNGDGTWLCGDGNWGDRYTWVTRRWATADMPVHSMARYPGVDAAFKSSPNPLPSDYIKWIGHAQIWHIYRDQSGQWVKHQVATAPHQPFGIGDAKAAILKSLPTV